MQRMCLLFYFHTWRTGALVYGHIGFQRTVQALGPVH